MYIAKNGPVPKDEVCLCAWDTIMRIARQHALIVQGYGGVVVLATPAVQREHGLREQVLRSELLELET